MVQFAGLIYGLLVSFVLSSAKHSKTSGRPHSPMVVYIGYLLCGFSAAAAVLLPAYAMLTDVPELHLMHALGIAG